MPDSATITFYDIASLLEDKAWSPNTWKIRYALNIKGIPYQTVWLDHPDIEPELKKLGIGPTLHGIRKELRYTLPAIVDPSTGVAIADSRKIAEYLDTQYPDTPRLFPDGTRALQTAVADTLLDQLLNAIFPVVAAVNAGLLLPRGRHFYRSTREEWVGMTLEELAPEGERRDELMKRVLHVLDRLDHSLTNGGGTVFMCGDAAAPSFADVGIAANLVWIKRVLGRESREWATVEQTNGGRWAKFVQAFSSWEVVPR
ncbi:hypothetical protein OF83DRAFT_1061438 [Amylostereum chailletii]|nr:hypothetical protein OF83DRAFT_1061438 [Amylostereum chailletii]